jgi:PAS domain S-box-containing protein
MNNSRKTANSTSYVSLDETSRALLEASVESALIMDPAGNVLAANDAAAGLFGLDAGRKLEKKNVYAMMQADTAEARRKRAERAIESATPVRFEEEMDERTLLHSIVPETNPWGKVARLVVSTLDLTDLRRTDEGLRREQQRQIFFMESLPGIVYHLYPDRTIRYANRYFRKYFGSPKNKSCQEALNCSENDCTSCPPMDAMKRDRAVEWDWTDSVGRTFHLQCSPMTDSAGERMIMVLGIDITARKKAEDELKKAHDKMEDRVRQRTRELERANAELTSKSMRLVTAMKKADAATRAKSAFLANMSHEIRTPLNAVLGMAELALRETNEAARDICLRRVMEAGNSLLSVINDILDFSKIEARKLTLESIDFDLPSVIEAALDIHRLQIEAKGLALEVRVAEEVPRTLVGDPSRLKQVLVNLVSNAVKFTEAGSITVSATLADGPPSPAKGDGVGVTFSVADTGIGIPEDKQKAIFESFLQADDSVTRKHGGTGLGLAICKLLVELMQGKLRLESEAGKGSTFHFTGRFTVGDAKAIPEEFPGIRPAQTAKLRVLLADDNALNRELAEALLLEQGHDVVSVGNGALALEAVKEQPFDLVLMDVQMPIMDGVTATRAIRDPNSGALDPSIPILAITAHALKGDRERFLEAGMNDYIPKPIRMDAFYAAIAGAVQGRPPSGDGGQEAHGRGEGGEPFDRASALEMLGGRTDLLGRMDQIFLRDTPRELEELKDHLARQDFESGRRLAHSIKGGARTVGAVRAGAQAEQMEFFCKQKDRVSVEKELKNLESEVKSALRYLAEKKDAGNGRQAIKGEGR